MWLWLPGVLAGIALAALPSASPSGAVAVRGPVVDGPPCSAGTIRVPSPGTRSIASAIQQAEPDTTIAVRAGQYRENRGQWFALQWSKPGLCLRGVGGRVVLRAAAGQNYGLLLTGDHTRLQGITLRGFSAGVSLGRDDGTSHSDIRLRDVSVVGSRRNWSEGIVAYADHRDSGVPVVSGLRLNRVSVRQTSLGISCNAGPCRDWRLRNVSVSGRGGAGESGADAFAVESGAGVRINRSTFAGVGGDGIDLKADDVLISDSRVQQVARNGIKLWRGGTVTDTTVSGTGADAALVGDGAGVYRYERITVSGHDPGGNGYVGTWGYDTQDRLSLVIQDSRFFGNATGGFFAPGTAHVQLSGTTFQRGGKLLDLGGQEIPATQTGLADLVRLGIGSGNRLQ